jgi:hypothetical protein
MGTRGAYGFRIDGEDKVTYNHFDSYPSGLGSNLVEDLVGSNVTKLKEIARRIILVNRAEKPTAEQQELLQKFANLEVSSGKLDEWYVLLREAQNGLDAWIDDGLPIMIDSQKFLLDSLYCEYAYIINLDSGMFEFYIGFNETPGAGRYGNLTERTGFNDTVYYGVRLVSETPLETIFAFTPSEATAFVEQLEPPDPDDEDFTDEEPATDC